MTPSNPNSYSESAMPAFIISLYCLFSFFICIMHSSHNSLLSASSLLFLSQFSPSLPLRYASYAKWNVSCDGAVDSHLSFLWPCHDCLFQSLVGACWFVLLHQYLFPECLGYRRTFPREGCQCYIGLVLLLNRSMFHQSLNHGSNHAPCGSFCTRYTPIHVFLFLIMPKL